ADVASDIRTLRRVTLILLLCGGVSALVGIVLWALPDFTAASWLSRLGRIGYPVGAVLRYREDGVAIGNERAIGTWIDPNAYGGFLLIVGGLAGAQLFARYPVTRWRWLAAGIFGLIVLALFLSDSRGAALGLASGLGVIALLRYRRLIWLGLAGLAVLPFLPFTQNFINRFIAGITAQDLETQMRLGEYQDALTLIGRYPVFGVGFTGVPDIDLYIGVSSTYLIIATYAGVLGLLGYLVVIASLLGWGLRWWNHIRADERLVDVWLGLLAGMCGAWVGGIFDHFYFNPEFQATAMLFWSFVGLYLAATRLAWQAAIRERAADGLADSPESAHVPPSAG
ncbi:MAG: O-antigen ligase family protein, partial [Anaerolineales bacterium]